MHCHLHLIPRRTGDHPNPRGGVRSVFPANIFGLIDGSKKLTYLGWISTQARIGHTRRDSLLPIHFVTDQFQKRRYISATKSCVTLLCYLERVAHSFLEGVDRGTYITGYSHIFQE